MAVPLGSWLTVDEYKAHYRIDPGDTTDDAAIAEVVAAAMERIESVAVKAFTDDTLARVPWTVHEAGLLQANRLMARRNSPDGVVGVSDMGTATVLSYDADITQNLSQWTVPVVA